MFSEIVKEQRLYFNNGNTLSYESRIKVLRQLKEVISKYELDLIKALNDDLNKSSYEAYITELSLVYSEINYCLKHLKKWMKVKRVKGSLTTFPAKSYLVNEPYGVVLVISPWNYPVQLSLVPLISALAAGNTVILKTSASSINVSKTLMSLINDNFNNSILYVSCDENNKEINEKFDYIFFTGGPTIARNVMMAASRNLTPVTLELGGKSPCIVDETANIEVAAKKIVYGKIINSGQTCIAPDYLYVAKTVKDRLIDELIRHFEIFYPDGIADVSYPKIINQRHFNRLVDIIDDGEIIYGGNYNIDSLKINLTLLNAPKEDSLAMTQEIFGPILPIFTFDDSNDVINYIKQQQKPLALYLFSTNKSLINQVIDKVSFGGGAINDTILHVANINLPFGGVGESGIGSYHGKYGYLTFTHQKPILKNKYWFDLALKYPPFNNKDYNSIRKLIK